MTAIALLNPKSDPHIVADTLLSNSGPDPNPKKSVWLPALGQIPSEWNKGEELWHITRLGRKTLILPNHSGILAFAADECAAAISFFGELGNVFQIQWQYEKNIRLSRNMIDAVLRRTKDSHKFTLLGVLSNQSGECEGYIHNAPQPIQTKSFGTCYTAGSGGLLVKEIILEADNFMNESGGWKEKKTITPTGELAERISAEMLYREGDYRNGTLPSTPINFQCGGFYEWYKVEPSGIKPTQTRMDLHVSSQEGKLVATRIYYSELMGNPIHIDSEIPSMSYYVNVLTLGLIPEEIPAIENLSDHWIVTPNEVHGVLINPTSERYDKSISKDNASRLSGPLSTEVLYHLFSKPVDVHRVRMTVTNNGMAIQRGYTSRPESGRLAQLVAVNDRLKLQINPQLVRHAHDVAMRLS